MVVSQNVASTDVTIAAEMMDGHKDRVSVLLQDGGTWVRHGGSLLLHPVHPVSE